MAQKLPPERAVRILRAFSGELEAMVGDPKDIHVDPNYLAAHLAQVCEILADHMETSEKEVDVPS